VLLSSCGVCRAAALSICRKRILPAITRIRKPASAHLSGRPDLQDLGRSSPKHARMAGNPTTWGGAHSGVLEIGRRRLTSSITPSRFLQSGGQPAFGTPVHMARPPAVVCGFCRLWSPRRAVRPRILTIVRGTPAGCRASPL
jgi:hypothetical protein